MAGLKTSRGWTRDAESVPTEIVGNSITSFLVFKSTATKFSRSRLAIRPLKRPSTSSGDDIMGRPGLRTLPNLLPNSTAARVLHALASPIPCNPSRSCTETPCNPKRSPLSEMTCPASATAVFSLLPVPRRMASNSALESASGPSDNSRSRGLSSGGSCLMVYLRVPTLVFYIIQASACRIAALQQVSEVRRQVSRALVEVARVDGRYRNREGTGHPAIPCGEHPNPWVLRVRLHGRSLKSDQSLRYSL